MDNRDYLIALNAFSGLGPQRIQKLLKHFGSLEKIFKASQHDLSLCVFLPEPVAHALTQFSLDQFLSKEHELLKKHNVAVISFLDEAYPKQLKEISDPPVVLYVKGMPALFQEPAVAIVGCRRASVYGITTAEKLACDLCDYNIAVVSGLARGIDTAAHRGALKAHGKTIAVLGNGLASVYPPENKRLFDSMAAQGLIVSEFPMATTPKPFHFPRRNRIISGLSLGIIVVEAAKKSGALITADLALEQGREVFAVPGKVDSVSSQGVHELIKQGAKLVTCIDDIIEELPLALRVKKEVQKNPEKKNEMLGKKPLSQEEKDILKLLSSAPIDVDSLCRQAGLPVSHIFTALLKLELSGFVKQLPGKLFVLK